MKKTKSQKVLKWGTKDIVLNVLVYLLNAGIITALFYLTVYLNETDFNTYFDNPTTFLHFTLMLVITLSVMAFYFAFEDKDFLKKR